MQSDQPKKQIAIGALPIRLGEDQREVTFQLSDPGIIRSVSWVLEGFIPRTFE